VTDLGYNDLVKLRSSLTDIEKNKVEIDQYLVDLQLDTSILVKNRDTRIPQLKKYRSELTNELPRLKQEIQDIESAIDSLKQEKQSFDESNKVMEIRDNIDSLNQKYDASIKSKIAKEERTPWIVGAFFAVIVGVLLTYTASEFGPSLDDLTYTCPDGNTIVNYDKLMDGTNDCSGGWDEKDSLWDTENGYSTKTDAQFDHYFIWFFIIVIVIAGTAGGAFAGFVLPIYLGSKFGLESTTRAHRKLRDTEYKHDQVLSKSDDLFKDRNNKKRQVDKLRSRVKTIDSKLEKLNALDKKSNLKEDDSIPYLENEVEKQIISISERIDQVRSKSNKIVDTFNQIKHLIPNSDSVNPTSSDLEDILNEISNQVEVHHTKEHHEVQKHNTTTKMVDLENFPKTEEKGSLDENGYEWIKHGEEDWYRIPGSNDEWIKFEN
jgi:hypothetical protein